MLPQVKQAMQDAAKHFVNMDELMAGVGAKLAELTGAEWGIVTSGAAAALCHATAACVAGGDPERMLRLPQTQGMKHKVLTLGEWRFTYDHAIRMPGVTIVEVSDLDEMTRAMDEDVAMIAVLSGREGEQSIRLEDLSRVARDKDIPVLVDAASEHWVKPDPYLSRGATMVAYSGGKYLRGPQPTGLLLGEKSWVEAAWLNAAPHHAFGRPMKVGKEEVMGVLAAVEFWAKGRDHAGEATRWRTDLETVGEIVRQAPSVTTEILGGEGQSVPRLEVRWNGDHIGIGGLDLRKKLLSTRPRIMLDDRGATRASIFILPFSLQEGEARIVGERIRDVLSNAPPPVALPEAEPAEASGTWDVQIEFVKGSAAHILSLNQSGKVIDGTHRTMHQENRIEGEVNGSRIEMQSLHRFEGTHLSFTFEGEVSNGVMSGTLRLGSTGQSAPGPLNQREYGLAKWEAVKR
jgi:L-seryl-tRNA(Ser) seleniumtransferase